METIGENEIELTFDQEANFRYEKKDPNKKMLKIKVGDNTNVKHLKLYIRSCYDFSQPEQLKPVINEKDCLALVQKKAGHTFNSKREAFVFDNDDWICPECTIMMTFFNSNPSEPISSTVWAKEIVPGSDPNDPVAEDEEKKKNEGFPIWIIIVCAITGGGVIASSIFGFIYRKR